LGSAGVVLGRVVLRAVRTVDTDGRGKILVTEKSYKQGEMLFVEEPVIEILQESPQPSMKDLKRWIDLFVQLPEEKQQGILELCCNEVAPKGVLASLLGQTGEGAKALSGDLPVEVVWKFLRIMEGNSFQVPTDAGVRVELVLLGSRMNHSCLPNALRGPGREKGTVEVRALRDLGEGEEVNVSYIGEALSKPTAPRRAILEARWQFKCLCERCQASDVLRAFRCEVCGGTHLVPGVGTGDSENSVGPCLACGAPGFAVDALERRWDVAFLAAEQDLGRAGRAVTAALEAKDGAALTAAVKDAFEALAAANRAEENCTLQMSHHLRLRFRKARVTLRSLVGDAFAAAGESASAELWGQSTVELQEGIEMEKQTLPFPRDKLVSELIQLSGLYRKLGMAPDAKRCLEDALKVMELIYWASEAPEAKQMKRDIEEALKA